MCVKLMPLEVILKKELPLVVVTYAFFKKAQRWIKHDCSTFKFTSKALRFNIKHCLLHLFIVEGVWMKTQKISFINLQQQDKMSSYSRMFRGRIRMSTCRIILITSLAWLLIDVILIMKYTDGLSSGFFKKSRDNEVRQLLISLIVYTTPHTYHARAQ